MFRRIRPKLVGVWLICGIILPAAFSYNVSQKLGKDHGVLVTKGAGSWYEHSVQAALARLTKKETQPVEISTYIWSPKDYTALFVIKGKRRCDLTVDSITAVHKEDKLVAAGNIRVPEGLSLLQLLIQPGDNLRDPITLVWSDDFVSARDIPAGRCYTHEISEGKIKSENIAGILGVVSRLNVLLIGLWIILRLGTFPLFSGEQQSSRIKMAVLALFVMVFLRFSGITYQLEEGLHPDEKLYGGMIQQVRVGEIAPTQFWYTTGYFFITAAAQRLAEWVVGNPIPQNLIQRAVSAICSSLTCVLVFSVARSFFSFEAAIVAMLFFGLTFMPVELAHYGIVEPTMVFFFFLAFASLVHLSETPSVKGFAKAGLLAGAAVAIKQTAALIGLPFLITWFFLMKRKLISRSGIKEILAWCGCAFLGFLALSPATILELRKFYEYQVLQTRSLEGEAATRLFFVDHHAFGGLALRGLHSAMGYPIIAAAIIGLFLIWKKSRIAGWMCVPAVASYLILISKITAVPEHYVLILCPFIALFAAITVDSLSALKPQFRLWMLAGATLLLLVFNLKQTWVLEKLLLRDDTRKQAVQWCYKNLRAGSKVDYEIFGPRFLIPMFDNSRPRIFERPSLERYLATRQPDYFVQDSLTTNVFLNAPMSFFTNERQWYEYLSRRELVQAFYGEKFRLLNPDIRIYKMPHSNTIR